MSNTTRLTLAVAAALVALALTASGAIAAPVATITANPPSSSSSPLVVTAGDASGQTVTFTNSGDKSKSTGALVATLSGTGFSRATDTCTGATLARGKSCSVSVTFPGAAPSTAQTATLTVGPKKGTTPAPVSAYFMVLPSPELSIGVQQLGGPESCFVDPDFDCYNASIAGSGLRPGSQATLTITDHDGVIREDSFTVGPNGRVIGGALAVSCRNPPVAITAAATAADGSPITATGDASLACPSLSIGVQPLEGPERCFVDPDFDCYNASISGSGLRPGSQATLTITDDDGVIREDSFTVGPNGRVIGGALAVSCRNPPVAIAAAATAAGGSPITATGDASLACPGS